MFANDNTEDKIIRRLGLGEMLFSFFHAEPNAKGIVRNACSVKYRRLPMIFGCRSFEERVHLVT